MDDTPLLHRVRTVFDQATASANGVMAGVLAKLFLAMGSYLNGLETLLMGLQIVIIGARENPKTQELITAVLGRSLPNRMLMVVAPGEELPEGHPAHGKQMENGQPTAYVCQHQNCSAPIANAVTLSQVLQLPARQPQAGQRPQ